MELFLRILMITGIVLGGIVGFLLLLILLVLFVPWRYYLKLSKEENLTGLFRVYWFLHLVTADLSYAGEVNLVIRILGIPFYNRKRKREKAEEKERKEEERRRKQRQESAAKLKDNGSESPKEETEKEPAPEKKEEKAAADTSAEAKTGEKAAEENKSPEEKEAGKKKIPLSDRISALLDQLEDTIWQMPERIEEGEEAFLNILEKGKEKVEGFFDTIEYYDRLLNSEGAHWVYEYVWKHGAGLLKAIRPTRFDADICYRDDDPGNVAKIYEYQVWAMAFTENIKGNISVDAMQDEKELKLHGKLTGRIFLWAVCWHGCCLVLNKKVKAFWKRVKREE